MMLRKELLCADYNVRSKIMGIALKMHIMLTVKQLTKNIACLYYEFIK